MIQEWKHIKIPINRNMKFLKYFEGIRNNYQEFGGVDKYYSDFGDGYDNPHLSYIKDIVQEAIDDDIVDLSHCLDMSCGNGEITNILIDNGVKNIEATDPYLCSNYSKHHDFNCLEYSFDGIMKGKLDNKEYSTIFCSYALHLSDKSILPNLLWNLSLISKYLVIISPNNNPLIDGGWELIKKSRNDKSKCRIYKSLNFL